MERVRILIIDEDEASRNAVAAVLGSDGWQVEGVARAEEGLQRLREGGWRLVLANLSEGGLKDPFFELLKELALAGGPLQVLFLVPAVMEERARHRLEGLGLPYVTKPVVLSELLERVGDLLLDAGAISQPLRLVRDLAATARVVGEQKPAAEAGRQMMAPRSSYYEYTEEELRQYEEEEERRRKKTKEHEPIGF